MSGNAVAITQAILELRSQGTFGGSHLLSPEDVMKDYWGKLKGSAFEVCSVTSELKSVMASRERLEFQNLVRSLLANDISREIVKEALQKYPSIFYCKRRTAFVGLGNDLHEQTINFVQKHYESEVSITEFLKLTHKLDIELSSKSSSEFEVYEDNVELQFSNNRLVYIRKNFEERVVGRFMENYTKGNSECVPVDETGEGSERTFMVHCKLDGKTYAVKNWKCECAELDRTGISCAHVIMLATLTG